MDNFTSSSGCYFLAILRKYYHGSNPCFIKWFEERKGQKLRTVEVGERSCMSIMLLEGLLCCGGVCNLILLSSSCDLWGSLLELYCPFITKEVCREISIVCVVIHEISECFSLGFHIYFLCLCHWQSCIQRGSKV